MSGDDSRSARLEELRAEQVRRWQRGERIFVEELLREHGAPDLVADSESLLDLIYSEVLLREEVGERPIADDFVARFPALADQIRRQFAVHAALPLDDEWRPPTSSLADATHAERSERVVSSAGTAAPTLPSLPEYELLEELGRGGMGVVYKARHRQLKRIVALKMIRDRALADATMLARFRAEAESVARLEHPHIVKIYDCGESDGCPYLSLEYVSGGSLESWTRPPLHPVRECAALVESVARAVGYAHHQQIVHRDLKPANILLAPIAAGDSQSGSSSPTTLAAESLGCRPKITDFGLAKQFAGDSNLTHSEAILGTGAYMSPEQAWGHSRDVGPWTDVHAMGVILYELLTGTTPFRDESLIRTLDRVRFEEAEPPSRLRPDVPPALDAICLRCLRKTPADRYATAEQLADDLRRFLNHEALAETPPTAAPRKPATPNRRWQLAMLGGLAILLLAGASWAVSRAWRFWPIATRPPEVESAEEGQPVVPPRTQPESFAFLVGVRSYEFGTQRVDLEYTESDVDELSRVLLKQGYPRKNIRLLTQWSQADNPELAPTASNIRRQLRTMLAACIPGDSVLVAITGMGGESGASSVYCYLPADAQLNQPQTLMPLPEFYDLFRDCRAERKILLVDTCQTASLPDFGVTEATVPPGVAALFACSRAEASYEHPKLRHGVFSYHVLRGLEGAADTNRDGRVAVGELRAYAQQGVQQFLRENMPNAVQTPMIVSSLDDTVPVTGRR